MVKIIFYDCSCRVHKIRETCKSMEFVKYFTFELLLDHGLLKRSFVALIQEQKTLRKFSL